MPSNGKTFDDLLEALPDALVGVDKAGVIRFVNRQTTQEVRLPSVARSRSPARPLHQPGRMLMTLASTTTSTDREITDCIAISPFARPTSGMVSVGLKASALVNAR